MLGALAQASDGAQPTLRLPCPPNATLRHCSPELADQRAFCPAPRTFVVARRCGTARAVISRFPFHDSNEVEYHKQIL